MKFRPKTSGDDVGIIQQIDNLPDHTPTTPHLNKQGILQKNIHQQADITTMTSNRY